MKFRIPTDAEIEAQDRIDRDYRNRKYRWHRWFAWYKVKVWDGEARWLETVWRRTVINHNEFRGTWFSKEYSTQISQPKNDRWCS